MSKNISFENNKLSRIKSLTNAFANYVPSVKIDFRWSNFHHFSLSLISGAVSMGSMGSSEPIDFLRGVLEPINFLDRRSKNWHALGLGVL